MEMKYRTMGDFSFRGKKVLLRADLNSSVINGKLEISERMRAHAETIKRLCNEGAAVTVLAHQGRPGEDDFIPLEQHAKIINKFAKISFVDDIMGSKAIKAITALKPGQALLLDNVRFIKEEFEPCERSKGNAFIKTIAPLFDIFVLDALSVAHRDEASVTGFAKALPSCMGPVMEREVMNISKLMVEKRPYTVCLGGLKLDDYFGLMEYGLKTGAAGKVLACGAMGELFLMASGTKLGEKEKFLEERGLTKLLPKAKALLRAYGGRIELPSDVAIEENGKRVDIPLAKLPTDRMIYDIGSGTIERYSKIIGKSASIFLKGTPGAYEKKGFDSGTKKILSAIAGSAGFSLIGGGDSAAALDYFNISRIKIGYISLSGGALLKYMAGERLPGLEALAEG